MLFAGAAEGEDLLVVGVGGVGEDGGFGLLVFVVGVPWAAEVAAAGGFGEGGEEGQRFFGAGEVEECVAGHADAEVIEVGVGEDEAHFVGQESWDGEALVVAGATAAGNGFFGRW